MEEVIPKIPNLDIAEAHFLLASGPKDKREEAKRQLFEFVKADNMAPYYVLLCEEFGFPQDAALLSTMRGANDEEAKRLDTKLEDAEQNLGETDISDALIAKAQFLAKIGDKDKALAAYRVAFDKTGPLGHRIDLVFAQIRIGFFFRDNELISRNIEKAKTLIEEGGDWDRRNRLKVYEGIYRISIRDFKGAVNMFLDTLATFTSTELMEYKDFVKYTVFTAALTLNRPDFKAKIIDAPEILEVIDQVPNLADYAKSLYACQYAQFFRSLAAIEQTMKLDRLLNAHYRYYVREMRIAVYAQLLQSYQSLTVESMANSFGVTEHWIDSDLSKYIAAGRLNAVIDKVNGVVETNRPDAKNAQYQATIKQGDLLLNRIQKLSRVINV
ncbi:26S proteasome non-ATPase regulatory subunit 6 [Geranomyces variabilis]|nr:26S proteasome subunit RPN7-domain-containing protein [Geranomyces variabilis]KAJ3138671.1 26S proteasome non-ATPase regulatory subunit 6 [Geranomyces variabilis]KAJ3144854.1 26S proteasome non-ATPase regulatory subunit 6 [Geranomyces variabilis]KAJ3160963.1 26S proteasome non-ATPase regulatory subunit 6 [Geranomyces variabilis]